MISYYSASKVFSVSGPVLENGVVAVDAQGKIIQLYTAQQAADLKDVQYFEGALVPGFVNIHCHLELSHLKDKIAKHTGLVNFIKGILATRQNSIGQEELHQQAVLEAMRLADEKMFVKGIVAVGDISNTLDSKPIKLQSKIHYHTFIELLGFNRPAEPIWTKGLNLQQEFKPLPTTLVPHAPYSVNAELLSLIANQEPTSKISIHNQETLAEQTLFTDGKGEFADFLASMGISLRPEQGNRENSLAYHLPYANKKNPLLLVHNTFTSAQDIDYAQAMHPELYWGLCPAANLYIENKLPDVNLMRSKKINICVGTDSLASNADLDILAELKLLQSNFDIPLAELLQWACINGAKFLGLNAQLGSLEIGKCPGLVWINNLAGENLTESSESIRII